MATETYSDLKIDEKLTGHKEAGSNNTALSVTEKSLDIKPQTSARDRLRALQKSIEESSVLSADKAAQRASFLKVGFTPEPFRINEKKAKLTAVITEARSKNAASEADEKSLDSKPRTPAQDTFEALQKLIKDSSVLSEKRASERAKFIAKAQNN